jgi:hypothetical protein
MTNSRGHGDGGMGSMRLDEEIYSQTSPYQGLICHEKRYFRFHARISEVAPLFDVESFDQRSGAALLYLDDRDDVGSKFSITKRTCLSWPSAHQPAEKYLAGLSGLSSFTLVSSLRHALNIWICMMNIAEKL